LNIIKINNIMRKSIEIKTIEEYRKTLSILFDMGYTWFSGGQAYYEKCFINNKFITLLDDKTMYLSEIKETKASLCHIVSKVTESIIRYQIVEKAINNKKWIIECVDYIDYTMFFAYDEESDHRIINLYKINRVENRIEKFKNIPEVLRKRGYSFMNHRFDTNGCIIIVE